MEQTEYKFYVTVKNIKNMCRICLEESKEMTNIHNKQNIFQLSIAEMVTICTDLKVDENEITPSSVCSTCKEEIIYATNFRLKFDKSYKFLKEYLLNISAKDVEGNQIIIINTIRDEFDDKTAEVCNEEDTGPIANVEDESKGGEVEKIYKCNKCGECFNSKVDRAHHQRTLKHYLKRTVMCSKCNLEVPVQNYKVHFLKHSITFKCELCDNSFSSKFSLQRHMRTHTNFKPIACSICNLKFARQDKLKEHMQIHSRLWCETCEKRFKDSQLYEKHLNTQGRCIEKYQRIFSCDICFKKFTLFKSLTIHKLLHTDKRVICPHCGKPYANQEKLNNHISTVHLKDASKSKNFLCNICAKQYSSKIILQRHILGHKGLAKRFNCDVCKKSFTQAHSLQTHLKIHTGEKPYICHICSKDFNKLCNLDRHLKIHNNISPHKCNICDKSFSCRQSLTVHTRTHTGEKPFSCSFCDNTFVDRSAMVKHARVHQSVV